MEESSFLLELKFIINLLCSETVSFLSVFSSDPLFSCIVTFCTLILLYLPRLFWKIIFSPVLILSGVLLLIILRLGATQRSEKENSGKSEPIVNEENRGSREEKQGKPVEPEEANSLDQVQRWVSNNSVIEFKSQVGFESSLRFEESFVEWNVKAPLEVIYEGEETEQESNEKQDTITTGIWRYPSLSQYYPESDSDSSSESGFPAMENWDSLENVCLRWDEEDREGLIEIALDGCKNRVLGFHFEEENLIEIDISPTRHREFSGDDEMFSGEISCN